jgi:hypothetical protein
MCLNLVEPASLQVTPEVLKLLLTYCRFHRAPGRSDKVRCPPLIVKLCMKGHDFSVVPLGSLVHAVLALLLVKGCS